MLRVRGDSMIEAGILDGDYVVVRQQARRRERATSWWPGSPTTRPPSSFSTHRGAEVVLTPANATISPMEFDPDEVTVYGKVVTVLRRL